MFATTVIWYQKSVISDGVEGAGNANTTVICCLYSQMRNAKFLVEVSENTGVIPSHLTPVQIDEHLLLLLLNSYC